MSSLRARIDEGRILTRLISAAIAEPLRPLIVHLVVTRKCNLACGYCYEADRVSPPVPLTDLRDRIAHLRRLRTVFVTLTGGEPLLHPEIEEVIRWVRRCGMIPVMNSNGFLLSKERIERLGAAGLFALQISVDNVKPNEVTMKSLKPLMPKLRLLSQHATFRVRVNTVLGTGAPHEAVEVARTALELGFDAKCSLVRDERGAVKPLDADARRAYDEIVSLGRRAPSYLSEDFQLALAERGRVEWKCRSGARYFTVCDEGLVHYCESSHGRPGTPLSRYGLDDIQRAFDTKKSCAPTCAVAYAHQASRLDAWRAQPLTAQPVEKICWEEHKTRRTAVLPILER